MMKQELLQVETDERGVCTLTFNAPARHNALDGEMVNLLLQRLQAIAKDETIRVLVLTGQGETFSSGADLHWMRSMGLEEEETNRQEARQLAALMQALNRLPQPTIARINGPAYGGAIGLIVCCDIAIATVSAEFAFKEVQLGLAPAIIAPYVVAAIGPRQARRFLLNGETIYGMLAFQLGLVHQVEDREELDGAVEAQIGRLLKAGPLALAECKRLLSRLEPGGESLREYTAELLARLRSSPEGQEGMAAFLEKRPPRWQR
ncbi:enoyl-CoA hydratase-related protein [Nitrosococcus halophilus]|nr:enoyl-CoA hydratase-related protein [Nitrosococcus halophilus]